MQLTVNKEQTRLGAAPIERRGLSDQATDRLRSAILDGELAPGSALSEVQLANALEVSRGPVRDAIARLRQEGLVITDWHRRSVVIEPTIEDATELYSLRSAIEVLAMREAIAHATTEDLALVKAALDSIAAAVEAQDRRRVLEEDVRFHDTVYSIAHHARLYETWCMLRSQVAFFLFQRHMGTTDYLDTAVAEHTALYEALCAKDVEAAEALTVAHLTSAYERLKARLSEAH